MRTKIRHDAQHLLRGMIVQLMYINVANSVLNPDDPATVGRPVIAHALRSQAMFPSDDELNLAIRYLETHKILAVEWASDGTGGWNTITLLATGYAVAERTQNVVGITMPTNR